jgi:hypothetical protein
MLGAGSTLARHVRMSDAQLVPTPVSQARGQGVEFTQASRAKVRRLRRPGYGSARVGC